MSDIVCQQCGHDWMYHAPAGCNNVFEHGGGICGCLELKPNPEPKLIRPVKCHFCNEPMFYGDDERREPEVRVTVETQKEFAVDAVAFYAHVRCWNERMK